MLSFYRTKHTTSFELMSLVPFLTEIERVFSFIDFMRWPHDSNLILNVLLRIFIEIAEVILFS